MDWKKLPLLGCAGVLALGAGYFMLHVEPRQEDLTEVDFRRLATMAKRVDFQLSTFQRVLANARSSQELPPPLEPIGSWSRPESRTENPDVTIVDQLTDGRWWFVFSTVEDPGKAASHQARLRADEVAQRALEPASFDKLILATRDGHILAAQGRADIELTNLSGLGIKDVSSLCRSTSLQDAVISGKHYKVFVRPCMTARADAKAKSEPGGWVICGLLGSSKFTWRSFRTSASWVILFFGLTVLALLSLPFVKLLTLGTGARLRAIDGLLAGLCAVIALSVLTVLAMDRFVYGKLADAEDHQLEELARAIQKNLLTDVDRALEDLVSLDEAARKNGEHSKLLEHRTDFFWADKNGRQILKWTPKDQKDVSSSLIPIGDRDYFQDALDVRQRGLIRNLKSGPFSFALQSVQSWTTGEPMVEVAIPERKGGAVPDGKGGWLQPAVAVLSTRFPSVHDTVLPPGFGFAIMDSAGQVLFHSNPLRMFQENFLEETGSQELRALMLGEREGTEKVLYMGLEHKVAVAPVPDLHWTVVAFRDLSVLRATNVQIITTALVCLIAYTLLFLALFSSVYLASSTRARWLWPAAARQGSYLQLAIFYAGCLLVHAVLLYQGNALFLLANGILIPLLVLFVSYLKIRADEGRSDRKQKAAWILVTGLLAASVAVGFQGLRPGGSQALAFSALVLGGLLLFLRPVTKFFRRWHTAPLRVAYLASAALLLTVLTAIPAASFLKAASDIPVENLLKHGQLRLMQQMDRIARSGTDAGFEPLYKKFFHTRRDCDLPQSQVLGEFVAGPHPEWLTSWQEYAFPVYSEESQGLARLSQDSPAKNSAWYWGHPNLTKTRLRNGKTVEEVRKVLSLYRQDATRGKSTPYLLSYFPAVGPKGRDWILIGAGGAGLLFLSFGVIWLLAENVLLLGMASPLWLDRRKIRLGASAGHVIYVSQRPERLRIGMRPEAVVLDFAADAERVESRRALKEPRFDLRRLIVLRRFDHRLADRSFSEAKLELLEELIQAGDKRIVLLSSQDPSLCLVCGFLCGGDEDPARDEAERERWRQALSRFAIIDLDGREEDAKELASRLSKLKEDLAAPPGQLRLDQISWKRHVRNCLHVIREECKPTWRLQEIGMELLADLCISETGPDEILQEVLARAERYYQGLWESLSEEEKLVVVQLAEEGLMNPKNLRPFQRLVARGMIRRDPAPRLFNESFRLFVTAAAAREGVRAIESKREQGSLWAQLKPPLTAALIGGLIFFGLTQNEMFKTTLSLVAAVAGALPHFLQLVGYLGTKTSVPSAH